MLNYKILAIFAAVILIGITVGFLVTQNVSTEELGIGSYGRCTRWRCPSTVGNSTTNKYYCAYSAPNINCVKAGTCQYC